MTTASVEPAAGTGGRAFPDPLLAAVYAGVFVLLGAAMTLRVHGTSANAYTQMAHAFLAGRLDVAPYLHDVAIVGGRGYYPFGPVPALILVPVVAVVGPDLPNSALAIPALAVAALGLWALLRLEIPSHREAAWWLLAAVAGTPLLLCGFADNPYYAAHVFVAACLAWSLLLALKRRAPLAAGVLVGAAAATRLDAAGAFVAIALLYATAAPPRPAGRWRPALLMLAGAAPFVLLLLVYNAARFGNPLESGYALQYLNYPWLAALRAQGLFSVRHLPENLYYLLVAGPIFAGGAATLPAVFPWIVPSEWGMGMIWTSPWLLLGAAARGRRAAILALGLLLVLLPSLFYYGVGWIQFGYRYGLDALPFFLLLAVWGARRVGAGARVLVPLFTWALLVNFWGDLWVMGMWGLPRANVG